MNKFYINEVLYIFFKCFYFLLVLFILDRLVFLFIIHCLVYIISSSVIVYRSTTKTLDHVVYFLNSILDYLHSSLTNFFIICFYFVLTPEVVNEKFFDSPSYFTTTTINFLKKVSNLLVSYL